MQGKNTWSIIRQGSPGNLESFEDIVFDTGGEAQDTPMACSVQVSQGDAGWKVRLPGIGCACCGMRAVGCVLRPGGRASKPL